jgi:hypothetical protein
MWFRQHKKSARPKFVRPMLERLEDRLVLANYTWVGPAGGGNWSTPANWTGGPAGTVPGYGDNVQFGGPAGSNGSCTLDLGGGPGQTHPSF